MNFIDITTHGRTIQKIKIKKTKKLKIKEKIEMLECELENLSTQISSKDTKTIKIFSMDFFVWKWLKSPDHICFITMRPRGCYCPLLLLD
jgi:hypothetical protein